MVQLQCKNRQSCLVLLNNMFYDGIMKNIPTNKSITIYTPDAQQLVTKAYLDGRLDEFEQNLERKIDLKIDKLESKFDKRITAVETRLDNKIEAVRNGLIMYIDTRFEPFEEMRKDFYSFKDQVLSTLDWLVSAFKKFDKEHTVLTYRYKVQGEQIEHHDRRLCVMEKKMEYLIHKNNQEM